MKPLEKIEMLVKAATALGRGRSLRLLGQIEHAQIQERLGERILGGHFPEEADDLLSGWEGYGWATSPFHLPPWQLALEDLHISEMSEFHEEERRILCQ